MKFCTDLDCEVRMTGIKIGELQGLELDILKHFHDYCVKNGIRYYLYAGTLLGAVRHDGFILG